MISREKLIALYSAMLKYRLLATPASNLPSSLQPVPGLEATVAAITADLRPDDAFIAMQTALAPAFADPSAWKHLLPASRTGRAHARGRSLSPSALARKFAVAVAAADALRALNSDAVSLLFCEPRMPAALWRTQLLNAARNQLPIVFVRLARDPQRAHVAPPAFVFGVPRIAVDANDVLAVYRVAGESIARARHRRGPTLIECLQTSSAAGASPDPVHAMELVLARKQILNPPLMQKIANRINREVTRILTGK